MPSRSYNVLENNVFVSLIKNRLEMVKPIDSHAIMLMQCAGEKCLSFTHEFALLH